jgi:hypothetical protein
LNLERGPLAVRNMIIADLRRFHELGARQYTADLLLVLRLFLTDYPSARCTKLEIVLGENRESRVSRLKL